MNSDKNTPRLLGAALSGNISDTMTTIADNALRMRASIVGEMITAVGLVLLGALLFATLKKQNGKIALVALGLYLIEAALLAVREILVFSLLRVSQESVVAGHPAYLQTLGNLFYESQSLDTHYLWCALPLGQHCSIIYSSSQDSSRGFYLSGAS
jgi:hypothetical protein